MAYKHKFPENIGLGKHASVGKGIGPKVQAYSERRRKHISEKMSSSEYSTFRPRVSLEPQYWIVRDWGSIEVPHLQSKAGYKATGLAFSALLNSLLPVLAAAVQNTTQIDADGNISIELNAGRINIR